VWLPSLPLPPLRTSGPQDHGCRFWARQSHRTKQNRRTAKALFAQIKAQGYTGGYSRVTDFIRNWRQTEGKAPKAFVPLQFEPGEAFQFDWNDEGMVVGGIYYKLQVAHLKLCLSRAFWMVAYLRVSLDGRL
jgi:transposase